MATIQMAKIGTASAAAGAKYDFVWNNPPWDTVLSYTAYPVTPTASGPHGAHVGIVGVTKVTVTWIRDNYNGDKRYVTIEITNSGIEAITFDLYQSWIA